MIKIILLLLMTTICHCGFYKTPLNAEKETLSFHIGLSHNLYLSGEDINKNLKRRRKKDGRGMRRRGGNGLR